MHYYEFHEAECIKRLNAGRTGWDTGDYDSFFMRTFVARSLARSNLRGPGQTALDLGCGTGALSCLLAGAGFDVTAIDISPTAIAFARQMASGRGLPIRFEARDVCQSSAFADFPLFDLIIDGHLLHCIVMHEERRTLLNRIRSSLKVGGEFWIETMLLECGQEPSPAWNLDDRGVVWTRLGGEVNCAEAVRRDDGLYVPQRLIARSRDFLLEELRAAGFDVIETECYPPEKPGNPGGFRARCS